MKGVGFLNRLGMKPVIKDRDPVFKQKFRQLLAEAGCEPHLIAPRCP